MNFVVGGVKVARVLNGLRDALVKLLGGAQAVRNAEVE